MQTVEQQITHLIEETLSDTGVELVLLRFKEVAIDYELIKNANLVLTDGMFKKLLGSGNLKQ